jgi:hypothetical protein
MQEGLSLKSSCYRDGGLIARKKSEIRNSLINGKELMIKKEYI